MSSPSPAAWTLRIDRRVLEPARVRPELELLDQGIEHLRVEFIARFEALDDEGAFRDFAPYAILRHPHQEVLDQIAEDLLEDFGWVIDFLPYAWVEEGAEPSVTPDN